MAPRKKLDDDFDASATPSPLKPKTEKAKVEKVKSEKAKVAKPKKEKAEGDKPEKPKAVKKVEVKKEKEKGDGGKKDGGKEKVKPVTGEEAQELILKYLKEQNRPYGATDVSANLHGKVCSFPSPSSFVFCDSNQIH
jgi:26S proteasome regulatory subunit, ATPase 3, interacting protein